MAKEWPEEREKAEARQSRIAEIRLSNDLGERLCEVLELDPMTVHRITIDLRADGPIAVTVEMFSTSSMLGIDWGSTFVKAKVEIKEGASEPT